jgi:hypothetical protein
MPLWAAIVIGIGSGLTTGLVGTFVTVGYQRAAEFRSRGFAAAEEFLRHAERVRRAARRPLVGDPLEALDAVRDAAEEMVPSVSLVEFQWGPRSDPAALAQSVHGFLSLAEDELRALVDGDEAAGDRASEAIENASRGLVVFEIVVAQELRRSAPNRAVRRLWRSVSRKSRDQRWTDLSAYLVERDGD